MRHLRDVVVEEACVGGDGVVGKRLDARAGGEGGAGLVEGDVPVFADAAEEARERGEQGEWKYECKGREGGSVRVDRYAQLNSPIRLDALLVCLALANQVLRVSVENVHLRWRDIDCATRQQPAAHPMPGGGAPWEKNSRNMNVW